MSRLFQNKEIKITYPYIEGKHGGIDIVAKESNGKSGFDNIVSHSNGVVVSVRSDYKTTDKTGNSYGNYVKIKQDNGMFTLYAHLKYGSVKCKVGDNILEGEIIGYMGSTGHTNGAHLHFEVRNESDIRINPTEYLTNDLPNMEKPKEPEEEKNEETKKDTKDSELLNLVKRTIRGDFGNGENRKRALGDKYDNVQRQVDLNYKNKTTKWDKVKIYK